MNFPVELIHTSASEAYVGTLTNLLSVEATLPPSEVSVKSKQGADRSSKEILNYGFRLTDALSRLTLNAHSRFSAVEAIARFVWMMGANDRLADIAFYSPNAKSFSDDGILVPGSSYGHRIFSAAPGIDQFKATIEGLRSDPLSRRAAVSVYQAEDAIRKNSGDVPCTFGFVFHVRDEKLHATVMMRSNNAHLLLPYNLFEFSLLAEVLASELGVGLGSIYYTAASMHLYAQDFSIAEQACREPILPLQMAPMPTNSLSSVQDLVKIEARLRQEAVSDEKLLALVTEGQESLPPYWTQFLYILALKNATIRNFELTHDVVSQLIESPLRECLRIEPLKSVAQSERGTNSLFDFLPGPKEVANAAELSLLNLINQIDDICLLKTREWEGQGLAPLTFEEQRMVRESAIGSLTGPIAIAAWDIEGTLQGVRTQLIALRSQAERLPFN